MPAFALSAYIAGSHDGMDTSEYYRSPVELGWGRSVKFDHDFLGRRRSRRRRRTLVGRSARSCRTPTTSPTCRRHCSGPETTPPFMDIPRDQRGFMWADRVTVDGELVGVATSHGYSYYFARAPQASRFRRPTRNPMSRPGRRHVHPSRAASGSPGRCTSQPDEWRRGTVSCEARAFRWSPSWNASWVPSH
jgi:hypothetical protein